MSKVYVVIGVYHGCIDSVQAFTDSKSAGKQLDKVRAKLGIQPSKSIESDNDAQVFEVEIQ